MPAQIVFNGKTYHSLDEMPPDVRQAYQQVMGVFADQDQNGVPDMMEGGLIKGVGNLLADANRDGVPDVFENAQSSTVMQTTTFVVDGKTYHSLDELPAEARQRYEAAMSKMGAGAANMPEWLSSPEKPPVASPNSLPSLIEPESTDWRLPVAGCAIFVLLIAVGLMAYLLMAQR